MTATDGQQVKGHIGDARVTRNSETLYLRRFYPRPLYLGPAQCPPRSLRPRVNVAVSSDAARGGVNPDHFERLGRARVYRKCSTPFGIWGRGRRALRRGPGPARHAVAQIMCRTPRSFRDGASCGRRRAGKFRPERVLGLPCGGRSHTEVGDVPAVLHVHLRSFTSSDVDENAFAEVCRGAALPTSASVTWRGTRSPCPRRSSRRHRNRRRALPRLRLVEEEVLRTFGHHAAVAARTSVRSLPARRRHGLSSNGDIIAFAVKVPGVRRTRPKNRVEQRVALPFFPEIGSRNSEIAQPSPSFMFSGRTRQRGPGGT